MFPIFADQSVFACTVYAWVEIAGSQHFSGNDYCLICT